MSYIPCAENEKRRIAYGYLAPIVDKGQISLFEGLTLHNVLHVPEFSIIFCL